jgi:hypothetical protein
MDRKAPGKGLELSEPAATRCISLGDMSSPLCGRPNGINLSIEGDPKIVPSLTSRNAKASFKSQGQSHV